MSGIAGKLLTPEGSREWRAHWPVVLAAMAGFATAHLHQYSMGVMIGPLEAEFHWSRTQITSGLLIVSLIVFPLSPAVGLVIDRFGPRRVALVGVALYCAAMASLALAQAPVWTWWCLWLLLALGRALLKATVWTVAISSLFDASRGLALAATMCATGLISFGAPVLTLMLIEAYGWRMTYALSGLVAAAIVLPALYACFRSPLDPPSGSTRADSRAQAMPRRAFHPSMLSANFVKLGLATLIVSFCSVGLLVNVVPILIGFEIGPVQAALIAGAMGVCQVAGRLGGGVLLDRFEARTVGAITVMLPAASCLLLLGGGGSAPLATLAILIFGLSVGAEIDVIAYLSSRLFGGENFGMLFGIIVGLMALGTGLGPVMASLVYDYNGSYSLALWAVVPLSAIGAWLLVTLSSGPARAP